MIDKRVYDFPSALADIDDGATILVGGFGLAGSPIELLEALIDQGARELTVVSNNAGEGDFGLAALLKAGRVAKVICSYPQSAGSDIFVDLCKAGKVALEVVPQGTMSERMREDRNPQAFRRPSMLVACIAALAFAVSCTSPTEEVEERMASLLLAGLHVLQDGGKL